jgi:hypothetical protein
VSAIPLPAAAVKAGPKLDQFNEWEKLVKSGNTKVLPD